MIVESFLNDLNNEIGFKFGTPWRYSDKSMGVIVPILKIGDIGKRNYITLEEIKDQDVKFKDSGIIDKVIIESSWPDPIFIRSGTILKSQGTQTRAVENSVVIVPQEVKEKVATEQEIKVRCIYASKGIRAGTSFTYGGDTPIEVRSALLSRSGQSRTWAAVGRSTHRFMSSGSVSMGGHRYGNTTLGSRSSYRIRSLRNISYDNLAGVMEEVDNFQNNVNEILKKVPMFEDQVGAIFLDMKDVVGIELFDHPKSWEAIHKEVEKRLGESATKEEEKTFFKPDYEQVKPLALGFLKKLIDSEKIESSKGSDVFTVTFLKGDGVVGEATSIYGKVVHLVGMKVDKSENSEEDAIVEHVETRESELFGTIGGPRTGSYTHKENRGTGSGRFGTYL